MAMTDVEVLQAACCIAGLDKKIRPEELNLLQKLAHQVGIGHVTLSAMIEHARVDTEFYEEQFLILKTDPEKTMTTMFSVAVCDGELSEDQRVVLQLFADRLGMDPARFDKMLAASQTYLEQRNQPNSD